MSKANLLLEDGTIIKSEANLNEAFVLGELVFNTSMTGYQEILTDPSYSSQIVVMTYPLIGNYGIFDNFSESSKIQVSAFIIRENSETNINGVECLSNYLAENGILCLTNTDTRKITKIIRNKGCCNCLITTEEITDKHKKQLNNYIFPKNVVERVSCKEIKEYSANGEEKINIALIDCGTKMSIIKQFQNAGAKVTVYPYDTDADLILSKGYDGVVLSNGPGNPKDAVETIRIIQNLIGKIDIFGICLGHQLIALSIGADTYKLKFGHRGGNHPVIEKSSGKVLITSQNHGYAVDEKTLPNGVEVTYRNINDGTVEGIRIADKKVESVQFHPEAGPGPEEAGVIIKNWINYLSESVKANA